VINDREPRSAADVQVAQQSYGTSGKPRRAFPDYTVLRARHGSG